MKRLASITLIALGFIALVWGVLGTQVVQDFMPLTLPSSGHTHTYLRWVPADPAPSPYLAPALIIVGWVAIVVGLRTGRRGAV